MREIHIDIKARNPQLAKEFFARFPEGTIRKRRAGFQDYFYFVIDTKSFIELQKHWRVRRARELCSAVSDEKEYDYFVGFHFGTAYSEEQFEFINTHAKREC